MGQYDWIEIRKNGVGDIYLILTSESSFLNNFVDFVDNSRDGRLGGGESSIGCIGALCQCLCSQVSHVQHLVDLNVNRFQSCIQYTYFDLFLNHFDLTLLQLFVALVLTDNSPTVVNTALAVP